MYAVGELATELPASLFGRINRRNHIIEEGFGPRGFRLGPARTASGEGVEREVDV
jgi:hypothetical protein